MNSNIEETLTVKNCTKCADFQRKHPSELLIPTETPEVPLMMVGTGLFDFECKTHLLTADHHSKFINMDRLQDLGSEGMIEALNS